MTALTHAASSASEDCAMLQRTVRNMQLSRACFRLQRSGSIAALQALRQRTLLSHPATHLSNATGQITRMNLSLPRRTLGNTEYQVCPLGFGASPLGSIYSVCVTPTDVSVLIETRGRLCCAQDLSEEVAIETVHEAFRQGINYFDTSPFYGEGLSEIVSTPSWLLGFTVQSRYVWCCCVQNQ